MFLLFLVVDRIASDPLCNNCAEKSTIHYTEGAQLPKQVKISSQDNELHSTKTASQCTTHPKNDTPRNTAPTHQPPNKFAEGHQPHLPKNKQEPQTTAAPPNSSAQPSHAETAKAITREADSQPSTANETKPTKKAAEAAANAVGQPQQGTPSRKTQPDDY